MPGAHHRILDIAFGSLPAGDVAILKVASDFTDDLGATDTDPFHVRMHAMAGPGQSSDAARTAYQDWIADSLSRAIKREREGCHKSALMALGMGMHAIMESYSGPHEGFQTWHGMDGLNLPRAAWHGVLDVWSGDSRVRAGNAAKELRAYYLIFLARAGQ